MGIALHHLEGPVSKKLGKDRKGGPRHHVKGAEGVPEGVEGDPVPRILHPLVPPKLLKDPLEGPRDPFLFIPLPRGEDQLLGIPRGFYLEELPDLLGHGNGTIDPVFGVEHVEEAVSKVHVSPFEGEDLPCPQATVEAQEADLVKLLAPFAAGLEQGVDLLRGEKADPAVVKPRQFNLLGRRLPLVKVPVPGTVEDLPDDGHSIEGGPGRKALLPHLLLEALEEEGGYLPEGLIAYDGL